LILRKVSSINWFLFRIDRPEIGTSCVSKYTRVSVRKHTLVRAS
jgi:hypothetical protein